MSAPPQMKAVVIRGRGEVAIETVPLPRLRDRYMIVKTTAVGLNPTDVKHVDFVQVGDPTGTRGGCDYAGVVEQVGSKVTKPFKKGDRVCGIAHGFNYSEKEDGTFAEYIAVIGDLQIRIPDNLSDVEAATLGVSITAVGQGLYQSLGLPLPDVANRDWPATPLLIWGGSTATGIVGVQFAKLSGCLVATTCSPKNFDYLTSLGADACFDYRSPACAEQIRAFFTAQGHRLTRAWDCVAAPETARASVAAMSPAEGDDCRYRALLPVRNSDVKGVDPRVSNGMTLAYTVFGERFEKMAVVQPRLEDHEFGKRFWELSRELLAQGRVRPARQIVDHGGKGLEGVLEGIKYLRAGSTSAAKVVYNM